MHVLPSTSPTTTHTTFLPISNCTYLNHINLAWVKYHMYTHKQKSFFFFYLRAPSQLNHINLPQVTLRPHFLTRESHQMHSKKRQSMSTIAMLPRLRWLRMKSKQRDLAQAQILIIRSNPLLTYRLPWEITQSILYSEMLPFTKTF